MIVFSEQWLHHDGSMRVDVQDESGERLGVLDGPGGWWQGNDSLVVSFPELRCVMGELGSMKKIVESLYALKAAWKPVALAAKEQ